AERAYYAQNGSYGDMGQLTSAGVMNIPRTERDGYAYSVEASSTGFTVTARHADSPPSQAGGPRLHLPPITVDQSRQVPPTNYAPAQARGGCYVRLVCRCIRTSSFLWICRVSTCACRNCARSSPHFRSNSPQLKIR